METRLLPCSFLLEIWNNRWDRRAGPRAVRRSTLSADAPCSAGQKQLFYSHLAAGDTLKTAHSVEALMDPSQMAASARTPLGLKSRVVNFCFDKQ